MNRRQQSRIPVAPPSPLGVHFLGMLSTVVERVMEKHTIVCAPQTETKLRLCYSAAVPASSIR